MKIGVSRNIKLRLATLQGGFHLKLSVVKKWRLNPKCAFRVENVIHTKLHDQRLYGEWFSCDAQAAIDAIETVLIETNRGKNLSAYIKKTNPVRCKTAQIGARISGDKRKAESRTAVMAIKDLWERPSSEHSIRDIEKKCGRARGTIVSILGNRTIAQYNYQAKLKRANQRQKEGANA